MRGVETLVETVRLCGLDIELERPRDPEALVSEEAFGDDEFLPYWAELWPSGLALAAHVASRDLKGLHVLELGCGLGLPSLAAAALGARVVATDWAADAVALLRLNAERNRVVLDVERTDWREPGRLDPTMFDLVLAADVLYEKRNAAPLARLLNPILARGGTAWIADPGRHHAAAFLELVSTTDSIATIGHPRLPNGGIHIVTRITSTGS